MNRKDQQHPMFEALTQGVTNLFGLLSALEKAGRQVAEGQAQRGDVTVEYRVATRTAAPDGEHDATRAAPPRAARRAAVPEHAEVLVDVFDEAEELVVVAQLPGVRAEDVRCHLDGDILLFDAGPDDGAARREVLLAVPVVSETPLNWTFHNGVLEVRLRKMPPTAGD